MVIEPRATAEPVTVDCPKDPVAVITPHAATKLEIFICLKRKIVCGRIEQRVENAARSVEALGK